MSTGRPPVSAGERALLSLEGLSVGDAFAERFFGEPDRALARIGGRELPPGRWSYTDDTEMALAICAQLRERETVEQHDLARRLAFGMDRRRGYGLGAYEILAGIRSGRRWEDLARRAFGGQGSYGNGAAVRVAPLGAYFATTPLDTVIEQARRSAEVTYAHPEGIAGAIAVAVAAALAWRGRVSAGPLGERWLRAILRQVPAGATRDGVAQAADLGAGASIATAAAALGSGVSISSPDTVPLCLWVAAHARDFEEALWTTVEALGDRDTTCAMVGSLLALKLGPGGIPREWRQRRETLPRAVTSGSSRHGRDA